MRQWFIVLKNKRNQNPIGARVLKQTKKDKWKERLPRRRKKRCKKRRRFHRSKIKREEWSQRTVTGQMYKQPVMTTPPFWLVIFPFSIHMESLSNQRKMSQKGRNYMWFCSQTRFEDPLCTRYCSRRLGIFTSNLCCGSSVFLFMSRGCSFQRNIYFVSLPLCQSLCAPAKTKGKKVGKKKKQKNKILHIKTLQRFIFSMLWREGSALLLSYLNLFHSLQKELAE